ncbi:hypothetical protein PGTUg99_030728 [Puccinia graminis f. sp. tritici]|uniref:Uncharacterized protein n=1 Tax=Puccinia graminis f. sp. tritici TaxID=56615 RepID=A0A5B0NLL9_PUCGR|nr:hypothetical protein PGTUg99_030728 [Puccinia graminis f. sp. tritici]
MPSPLTSSSPSTPSPSSISPPPPSPYWLVSSSPSASRPLGPLPSSSSLPPSLTSLVTIGGPNLRIIPKETSVALISFKLSLLWEG